MDWRLFTLLCICIGLSQISAYPQPSPSSQNSEEQILQVQDETTPSPSPPTPNLQVQQQTYCLEDRVVGPCRAWIPRYYFNQGTGRCAKFVYGGCEGSNNRFNTVKECEDKCSTHVRSTAADAENSNGAHATLSVVPEGNPAEICALPHTTGPSCKAYVPRWTYNATAGECVKFIYKGCGATKNNFQNKVSCEKTCGGIISIVGDAGDTSSSERVELKAVAVTGRTPTQQCLPTLARGPCFGAEDRYHFNQKNNRCERFEYGGCGGNSNNFKSAAECQRTCGGDEPSHDSACALARVDCPWSRYAHYKALGCAPVYDAGACCPTRFDCPDSNMITNGSVSASTSGGAPATGSQQPQCHYKGRLYAIGEFVQEASSSKACRAGCVCTATTAALGGKSGARITCANIECPEQLGATPPGKENCRRLYRRESCCAADFYCEGETEEVQQSNQPFTCEYEGKSYVEGERIYPSSSCQRCLCQRGWNGNVNANGTTQQQQLNPEFCEPIDCGIEIYYADKLERGCAPVYFQDKDGQDSCCPISWQCPDDQQLPAPGTIPPVPAIHDTDSSQVRGPAMTILPVGGPIVEDGTQGQGPSPVNTILPIGDSIIPNDSVVDISACTFPKMIGPCKGHRPRFYYNGETKACEAFVYGGCQGNKNNFVAMADCQRICGANQPGVDEGTPELVLSRGKSIPATPPKIYTLTETDPCDEPMAPGPCRAYFARFYYNPEENSCQFFVFGGCKGNRNNFYTKTSCEAMCQDRLPVQTHRFAEQEASGGTNTNWASDASTGPSSTSTSSSMTFEVDRSSSSGGADAKKIDTTTQAPTVTSVCALQPITGHCKGYIKRFYFDGTSCKLFIYGGCGGNGNNFESDQQCLNTCALGKGLDYLAQPGGPNNWRGVPAAAVHPDPEEPTVKTGAVVFGGGTERCYLPKKAGSCYALIKSFYYDVSLERCEEFAYGGCFGNTNRFSTLEECRSICERPLALAKSRGGGGGTHGGQLILGRIGDSVQSQHFHTSEPHGEEIVTGAQDEFQQNIVQVEVIPTFNVEASIHNRIHQDEKVFCSLPPEKGGATCKEAVAPQLRYYWHGHTASCLPFHYNGCGGNSNNFFTESDCLSICGAAPTLEQLGRDGALDCTFGNQTLAYGATYYKHAQGTSGGGTAIGPEKNPTCGVIVCSCQTPPALTCSLKACPDKVIPVQPVVSFLPQDVDGRHEEPCPQPNCASHCTQGVSKETGCPVCNCSGGARALPQGVDVEHVTVEEEQSGVKG